MKKQTIIALFFLAATLTASGQTQQPVKTNEQIAADAPITMFIPDEAVAAKLTPAEQAALKLHLTNLMANAMKVGYQSGAKDTSDSMLREFAKYAAEQRTAAPQQPRITKLDKLEAVLRGIATAPVVAPTPVPIPASVNCTSRQVGNTVYTTCR